MVALAVLLALVASGCVGPSRTDADYRRKAANAAEAMVSIAESTRLTVEVASDGRGPGPYVSLRMREAETSADGVIASFAAVQPPSTSADRVREELLRVLEDTSSVVADLRIAAYRNELDRLPELAEPLEELVPRLEHFMEIAPT